MTCDKMVMQQYMKKMFFVTKWFQKYSLKYNTRSQYFRYSDLNRLCLFDRWNHQKDESACFMILLQRLVGNAAGWIW